MDAHDISLSAAYITLGAMTHPEQQKAVYLFDNGQINFVSEAVTYAPLFEGIWDAINEAYNGDFEVPGVYAYEVQEPFGTWFTQWVLDHSGEAPTQLDAVVQAAKIACHFFGGDDPDATLACAIDMACEAHHDISVLDVLTPDREGAAIPPAPQPKTIQIPIEITLPGLDAAKEQMVSAAEHMEALVGLTDDLTERWLKLKEVLRG